MSLEYSGYDDIDAIRKRWCGVSSNDIGLNDAQRQILVDFETVLEAFDELAGGDYKEPDELTDLVKRLAAGQVDAEDIAQDCTDLANYFENRGHVHAAKSVEALAPFLERLGRTTGEDVDGMPRAVARAVLLLWDQRDDDYGHRAEFVLCGWRAWLDGPSVVLIEPDLDTRTMSADDVTTLRKELGA